MKNADIQHHRLKWRRALRIASQSPDRWLRKAAEWNLGLRMSTETQRRAERPTKRWQDDLVDIVKDEQTDATQRNDLENKNTWLIIAKNINECENALTHTIKNNNTTQRNTNPTHHHTETDTRRQTQKDRDGECKDNTSNDLFSRCKSVQEFGHRWNWRS